jgi:hypothetical protein
MAPSDQYEDNDRLYLDDLYIGQRFTSRSHALDEAQIKAFAGQFDPQPFHLDDSAAKGTLFAGLARGAFPSAGTGPSLRQGLHRMKPRVHRVRRSPWPGLYTELSRFSSCSPFILLNEQFAREILRSCVPRIGLELTCCPE